MKTYLLILLSLSLIIQSCSIKEEKLESINLTIFNDTLNIKQYPFKEEYKSFLRVERSTNNSLKKENPEYIIVDPKYKTPLPKKYVVNEEETESSITSYLKGIEKNTNNSVYCNIEYWIEWNSKLSYVKILTYKGELPSQKFIMDIFEKIKFKQKEFKPGLPYPRSKAIWFLRINTNNDFYYFIRNIIYIVGGLLILILKPFSKMKTLYSRKIELMLGFSFLVVGVVLLLQLVYGQ